MMNFDPAVYERLAVVEAKLGALGDERLQQLQERVDQLTKQAARQSKSPMDQAELKTLRDHLDELRKRVEALERHGFPQLGNAVKLQNSPVQPHEVAHMTQQHQGQVINYHFPIEVEVVGRPNTVTMREIAQHMYGELITAVENQTPLEK